MSTDRGEGMRQRMSRVWFVSVVAGVLLVGLPATASAAPPQCVSQPRLYELPAGLEWLNPRAPCKDPDGDPLTIEIVDGPEFGTFQPEGPQPIDVRRMYRAKPDAAGNRDSITFAAVTPNGERSNPFRIDVWILPPHSAPVCKDIALTVRAGSAVAIRPDCVDADDDTFVLSIKGAARHGTFDPARRTYTAAPRFAGQDTMTYVVVDEWQQVSAPRRVTITVKPAPGKQTNTADKTAPTLKLLARSRLGLRFALRRGIRLRTTASEPGRIAIEALIGARTARNLGIDRRVGSLVRDLAAGKTTLRLRLYRNARRHLADLEHVRLRLVARMVDTAGNVRTERLRIRLAKT